MMHKWQKWTYWSPFLRIQKSIPCPDISKQVVITDMEHNAETLKNELVQNEPLPAFEYQTLEATYTFTTGEKPATYQYFYPLYLYQHKTLQLTKASCSFPRNGVFCHIVGLVNHSWQTNNCEILPQHSVPAHRISRPALWLYASTIQLCCWWEVSCGYSCTYHLNMSIHGISLTKWNSKVVHGVLR